jgi:hypothetical protein
MSTRNVAPSSSTKPAAPAGPETPAIPLPDDRRADDPPIRPFSFHASDEDLADLKQRINATRWPDRETVSDDSQGVQLATMQKLADYWANEYDWRKVEATLNGYPQFVTEIDGLDIHFIYVRSKHDNALPIIVTHGWPGSIVEQLKIIGPLTDPTAFGGTAKDAFDVVIPSIPGYGFSARPTAPGWNPPRIAQAWLTLMKRLGYDRFVAQGGDWGALMTETLGVMAPPELIAIHTNMPSTGMGRPPTFRPRRVAPTSGSSCSSPTGWLTPSRWASAHRPCTESPTPRSVSRPGSSIMTS